MSRIIRIILLSMATSSISTSVGDSTNPASSITIQPLILLLGWSCRGVDFHRQDGSARWPSARWYCPVAVRRRDGSWRWPRAGLYDARRTAASPPETRTSRYRDDSAISGIGRDYERLAGVNFPRGFLVYLFCQLNGVVGVFICKKTQHRWMAPSNAPR